VSSDGFVYVCDRPNDRIQVFTRDGKFVKEKQIVPETLSDGSVWDIAFSRDPQQHLHYGTYTGKRLQKFVFKGLGAPQRGIPWPTGSHN